MQFLQELWVPIVLSTLACFAASALAWIVLPHHRGEWKRLPTEPAVLDALRQSMPPRGLYAMPFAMGADLNRADLKVALEKGPVGFVTIAKNGPPNMILMSAQMIAFFALTSTLCAYVAWHGGLRYGAAPRAVFRVIATVALMAYTFGSFQESVWFGRPWKSWLRQLADGLTFALISGAMFSWLWPL